MIPKAAEFIQDSRLLGKIKSTLTIDTQDMRTLVIGNSGSGKSTLAKRLASEENLAHLDLDTVAWKRDDPTTRLSFDRSCSLIDEFTKLHPDWVIEGCYATLIEYAAKSADSLYFMNLSTRECIENCRRRPWEPHKYPTKDQQDENLPMLVDWIARYPERDDEFSYRAHRRVFDSFAGEKSEITTNSRPE